MAHIWNFLKISLYPVGAILICGFIVWLCLKLFMKLLGRGGYRIVIATSLIGTPIHELGHAAMCLLCGHKVSRLVLWQPPSEDGLLGYVRHTYNSKSLPQKLGNLLISTGPIFSGMAVLSLMLMLAFPNTWDTHVRTLSTLVNQDASVAEIISCGLQLIPSLLSEFSSKSVPIWAQLLALLVMLSVSLHINLSPEDLRGVVDALPPYLAVTLVLTAVATLLGSAATGLVLGALQTFHTFMMATFTVVLVFAAAQVTLALVLRLLLRTVRS